MIISIPDLLVVLAMAWFCGFAFAKRDYGWSAFFGVLMIGGTVVVSLMAGGGA